MRGRIGAHRLHASHDSRQLTAAARAAFKESFERLVDPDGRLSPEERARRAAQARSAHYARLARLGALARRERKSRAGEGRIGHPSTVRAEVPNTE